MTKRHELSPRANKAQKPLRLQQFYNAALTLGNQLVDTLRCYVSCMAYLLNVTTLTKVPQAVVRTTEFLAPSIRLINGLKLLYRANFEDGKWTQAINIVGGIANTSLAIASFAVPTLVLVFITANIATNVALGLWSIAVVLKDRMTGTWSNKLKALKQKEQEFYSHLADPKQFESFRACKHRDQDQLVGLQTSIIEKRNEHIELNADLATKFYNTGLLSLALSGSVMCFFPSTFVAGATLLVTTTIHGFIFGYDLGGRLPQSLHRFFFKPCSAETIATELEEKVIQPIPQKASFDTTQLFKRLPSPKPAAQHPIVSPTSPTKQSPSIFSSCPPQQQKVSEQESKISHLHQNGRRMPSLTPSATPEYSSCQ